MQIASLKTVAAIFVAGFLILPFAKQGRAQESPKQQLSVSETQLRAFAKVYVEVEKIRQAYEPRLKEAKNPEEGKQIQNEAASKMQGALTKEGLTEVPANFFIRADLPARGRWPGIHLCPQQGATYQVAIYEQSASRA